MAKYKIVHYLNQFFGGICGEDKADFQPEVREEINVLLPKVNGQQTVLPKWRH